MLHLSKAYFWLLAAQLCGNVQAVPIATDGLVDGNPVSFLLAGDSTTATNGGWGDAFVKMLKEPASGQNFAKGGQTTVSFRAGGFWNSLITEMRKRTAGNVLAVENDGVLRGRDSEADGKPAWFVLAGDSTTAKQSDGGGGWGNGFLRALQPPSGGKNHGVNGQTTVSFKRDYWSAVISEVRSVNSKNTVYVTIQFGHNDQKTDKGISLNDYERNLKGLAKEVVNAGGIPILVTPLTRRTFDGPRVKENLRNETQRTIDAAKTGNFTYIDLNGESTKYVNAIGQQASYNYNLKPDDRTHLNTLGSEVFGTMVADLIIKKIPDSGRAFKRDEQFKRISAAIDAGKSVPKLK